MLGAVLASVALTAWAFTVVGVVYALWRYAYLPFMVMRKDLAALDTKDAILDAKIEEVRSYAKQEFGLRAARSLSDEEQARMEAASRRLSVWQQLNQGR